jgi:serine/threonine protein kinase
MRGIQDKGASDPVVVSSGSGSGWSRLETLPDSVIEQLKRRQYSTGQTIGERYRLKALLGMGAMGQVFVAENMAIGVEVAVKLLKAELIASREFRQRFQKEAEAVGSINHQNVARFLDLVVGDPTFLVMEYVAGPTLHQLIEHEKRLPYERALTIAARLCWGLDAAHARGIIHRDLKPANIILASDSEIGEQPKIVDFGLAKLATATQTAELTRTGQIVGTPEYMAPEQIEGKKVDARADVYSLGCVLYKMLVGRSPFSGEDDVQVLYRQLHEPPQPPSTLVPGIPTSVDQVLARALAKAPTDRYPDTRELAHALDNANDRRRPSRRSGIETPAKAKPPVALIAATTLAVGAVAGVLLGRDGSSAPTPTPNTAPVTAPSGAQSEAREMLVVATEPPGATVEIDGVKLPETTPTAKRGVTVGKHMVKLTKQGYGAVERTITIAPGARESLDVNLPPQSRHISVRTIPTGAAVYLDNQLVSSSTPADVTVRVDEFYAVRVEKLGFEPLTKNITPDDTATELELRLDEEKLPMGYLWIDTNGVGDVWIDGRDTGFTAPTVGMRLRAGRHVVELRDSTGARSKPLNVTLDQGQSLHVLIDISVRK